MKNVFINTHFRGVSKGLIGDIAVIKQQNHLNHDRFTPICINWDNTIPQIWQ